MLAAGVLDDRWTLSPWAKLAFQVGAGLLAVRYGYVIESFREPLTGEVFDFPFWFAYGYVNGDELEQRMARFEQGLSLLAEFEVPVLVGDLPDMRGAATRLLSPQQVPSEQVLGKLNERLKQWAKEHENVTLVPLAETVKQLKVDGVTLPLASGAEKTPPGALLQGDRLHATRLGVAFLVHRLQEPLRALFPEGHALHEQQWTFEQFVEAAGAETTLDDVRAAAKKAGGAAKEQAAK